MQIEKLLADSERIPMLPDTAIRLQELLEDGNSTIQDIADVVAVDPPLTSKLLKLANSAFYNFPTVIDTVSRAVNVIGTEATYNLAIANSAVDTVSDLAADCIDLDRFWRQSVDTALVAKDLTKQVGAPHSERLFVCGLLCNLGELICADQYPELTKQASIGNDGGSLPWDRQLSIFNFTYAKLSQELMRLWRLPSTISNPVGFLHTPEKSSQLKETKILHIAALAALYLSEEVPFQLESLLKNEDLVEVGGNWQTLEHAIDFANIESLNILSILSPRSVFVG